MLGQAILDWTKCLGIANREDFIGALGAKESGCMSTHTIYQGGK